MKNKTPLMLMEQLIMILVFALAAAICIRAFMLSDGISSQNSQRDRAALLAQNAAETLKSCGDMSDAALALGGMYGDGMFTVLYEDNSASVSESEYILRVQELERPAADLYSAAVSVSDKASGEELFSLTVTFREVAR